MVERIRELLETRQLTPTQFADTIGIARPIVSHILSGRNKPSLEVVQRILAAMPELSMPWLLNGTGAMLSSAVTSPAAAPEPVAPVAVHEPLKTPKVSPAPAATAQLPRVPMPATPGPAPYQPALAPPKAVPLPAFKRFSPRTSITPAPIIGNATPVTQPQSLPTVSLPPQAAYSVAEAPVLPAPIAEATSKVDEASDKNSIATALFAGAEKPIRRIVIFYRDGSFADYQPE